MTDVKMVVEKEFYLEKEKVDTTDDLSKRDASRSKYIKVKKFEVLPII